MSETHVQYKLTLEDLLSGKLLNADHLAKALEGTIKNLATQLVSMAAVFEGFEFFKDAYTEYEKIHQAQIQLGNTLRNVGDRAGLTEDNIVSMAKTAAKSIDFTVDSLINAGDALSRYKNISKETFEKVITLSADLSTINHESIESTATVLGRVLEAPAENMRLLRQMKISFTADEKEKIKTLEETGHVAEAQIIIFKALEDRGYAGAAAIAAQNDPLFQWREGMREVKEELGEMIYKLIVDLKPQLIWLVDHFKMLVEWIDRNGATLKALVEGLGAAYLAFKAMTVITVVGESLTALAMSADLATVGLGGVGAAMTAALGPINLLAIAIGGVVFAYNKLNSAQKSLDESRQKIASDAARSEQEGEQNEITAKIKNTRELTGVALARNDAEKAIYDRRKEQIKAEISNLGAEPAHSTMDQMAAFGIGGRPASDKIIQDWELWITQKERLDAKLEAVGKTNLIKKGPTPYTPPVKPGKETNGIEGPKVVNINVTIGNLVDKFTVSTLTTQESPTQIKQLIATAIVGAVHDAEVLVGTQH